MYKIMDIDYGNTTSESSAQYVFSLIL